MVRAVIVIENFCTYLVQAQRRVGVTYFNRMRELTKHDYEKYFVKYTIIFVLLTLLFHIRRSRITYLNVNQYVYCI